MYNMFSMGKTVAAGVNNAHTDLHQSADKKETVLAKRGSPFYVQYVLYEKDRGSRRKQCSH